MTRREENLLREGRRREPWNRPRPFGVGQLQSPPQLGQQRDHLRPRPRPRPRRTQPHHSTRHPAPADISHFETSPPIRSLSEEPTTRPPTAPKCRLPNIALAVLSSPRLGWCAIASIARPAELFLSRPSHPPIPSLINPQQTVAIFFDFTLALYTATSPKTQALWVLAMINPMSPPSTWTP